MVRSGLGTRIYGRKDCNIFGQSSGDGPTKSYLTRKKERLQAAAAIPETLISPSRASPTAEQNMESMEGNLLNHPLFSLDIIVVASNLAQSGV